MYPTQLKEDTLAAIHAKTSANHIKLDHSTCTYTTHSVMKPVEREAAAQVMTDPTRRTVRIHNPTRLTSKSSHSKHTSSRETHYHHQQSQRRFPETHLPVPKNTHKNPHRTHRPRLVCAGMNEEEIQDIVNRGARRRATKYYKAMARRNQHERTPSRNWVETKIMPQQSSLSCDKEPPALVVTSPEGKTFYLEDRNKYR